MSTGGFRKLYVRLVESSVPDQEAARLLQRIIEILKRNSGEKQDK